MKREATGPMTPEETHRAILEALRDPDPDNPYVFNGVDHSPRRFARVMRSCEDVVRVTADCMRYHSISVQDLVERSGRTVEEVMGVIAHGKGSVDVVMDVLEAADIIPVVLPLPAQLMEGA